MATQCAVAYPEEGGRMRVLSSTQGPAGTQRAIARILGVPIAQVEVEAGRLGGGFGGKEDQAAPWASLAALGARATGHPVKLVLSRGDDLRMTGKRHPYSSDFRLALGEDGKILGFHGVFYQNSGASIDLSLAILWRTLFHAAGTYKVPAVRAEGYMCRTNLPPFTAYRGFGAPQGFFVMEAAIMKAAEVSGIPAAEIQRRNLLSEGDVTHYGMKMVDCRVRRSWDRLTESVRYPELRREIDEFNAANRLVKRGAWLQPVGFGISFTKLMMNQGGALVHVFPDGSVSVATGAVEMGQGVMRKILIACARTFGIHEDRLLVEKTKTTTVANTVPTAASTGADINGMAALLACGEIRGRMLKFAAGLPEVAAAAKASSGAVGPVAPERLSIGDEELLLDGAKTGVTWGVLIGKALEARVDLSAHGYYATPGLSFDLTKGKGDPFAYHVYGAALVVAELDVLRATYRVVRTDIVHDGGIPIDEKIDRGQIEGALAQGLGWAVLEDLRYGPDGSLQTDTLSTYKLPDLRFMDFPIDIEFLSDAYNPKAVLGSKGVGEPPFIYGIAGYFAVMDALKAARTGSGFYDLPMTAEKALGYLAGGLA
jgi:xanthine dehydrogenase large subunit